MEIDISKSKGVESNMRFSSKPVLWVLQVEKNTKAYTPFL